MVHFGVLTGTGSVVTASLTRKMHQRHCFVYVKWEIHCIFEFIHHEWSFFRFSSAQSTSRRHAAEQTVFASATHRHFQEFSITIFLSGLASSTGDVVMGIEAWVICRFELKRNGYYFCSRLDWDLAENG